MVKGLGGAEASFGSSFRALDTLASRRARDAEVQRLVQATREAHDDYVRSRREARERQIETARRSVAVAETRGASQGFGIRPRVRGTVVDVVV